MTYNYEWKRLKGGGKRLVRTAGTVTSSAPVKAAPVEVPAEAVVEAEYVPEVKIEAEQVTPKRGPGRPKKVDAPVIVEDDDDE